MNRVTYWHHWLLIVSLVIAAIGLFTALLNQTPLFDLFGRQFDRAFWDSAPLPAGVTSFQ
jgi:hypothetical protein